MAAHLKISILLLFLCSVLFADLAFTEETSNLLDGKSFIGHNGEKGKKLDSSETEVIVFENGQFISTSCYQYNFAGAPYSAARVGDSVHFEAVTESPTHGRIAWKGVVRDDMAEVTFVWTKERWFWDTHREYWFKGTLKK